MKKFTQYLNESRKYDELSEEEQLKLIQQDMFAVLHITNPSEKVQMKVIFPSDYNFYPGMLQFIKNPTLNIQKLVVKRNAQLIEFLDHPDIEVQKTAVQSNGNVIKKIKNPDPEVLVMAILKSPELLGLTTNDHQYYNSSRKLDFAIFEHLPKDIQEKIIQKNPLLINRIQNLDPELAKQYKRSILSRN